MESELDNLMFSASTLQKIGRYDQAIDSLKQIIKLNPILQRKHCFLFEDIFKPPIEQIRKTLLFLQKSYEDEISIGNMERSQCILFYKNKSHDDLIRYCHEGISLIDNIILEQTQDDLILCYIYKTKGDFYRYISECGTKEEVKDAISNAIKSYSSGLSMCERLSPASPLRLGTILVFAIFKHDHLGARQEATEMLQAAKRAGEECLSQLDHHEKAESLHLLDAFRTNLNDWE